MQLQIQREPMNTKESAPSSLSKLELNSTEQYCSAGNCQTESIIVLGERPFCLQHFLTRCYEWLDQLDPAARGKASDAPDQPRIQAMVEECSNRALLVSLRCESLTNLDRSRLLDILLRCSDLLFMLRIPSTISSWLPVYPQQTPEPPREKKISLGSQLLTNKLFGV
jgi:hypothetical protein